ncbi:IclR family transcriptional regulator C-terminal domain-containing protein [Streptomyces sp. NPDC052207]|uniref:IclR family transcriptional regulator domain-containing protein n=1 Tax=Streptomyces sp. NPDC052207 TaxID=3155418 RepID=UPI00341B7446
MTQLDGSDIVYVARVAVPKLISLAVTIGTRFPAPSTSQGKVLLAALPPERFREILVQPSRSGVTPRLELAMDELESSLREVRARGWAVADEELAAGVRSVAVPVRDGDGSVVAAMNVTVHAAETSLETLVEEHLPRLLQTASAVSSDWAAWRSIPLTVTGG